MEQRVFLGPRQWQGVTYKFNQFVVIPQHEKQYEQQQHKIHHKRGEIAQHGGRDAGEPGTQAPRQGQCPRPDFIRIKRFGRQYPLQQRLALNYPGVRPYLVNTVARGPLPGDHGIADALLQDGHQ